MRFRLSTLLLLSLGHAATAGAQLTIHLTAVPPSTPFEAQIFVAGSFNGWTPDVARYRLTAQPGGGYAVTLPDSVRGPIEFKFTMGSWQSAELTSGGAAAPNRSFTVPATGPATLDATVARWDTPHAEVPVRSTASASVSVMSDSFAIPQLGRSRRVWVYLPPGYRTSKVRYPVLYLQDGQNLFDARTSYSGEWGVDETLDSLRKRGDRGVIVVAVDNGGPKRLDEYNPWKNTDPRLGGGEGDAYVEFLVHDLKPYVDAHYRTESGRTTTGIGGSSAGALIALYAVLKYPNVFGRAALMSPATWLAGTHMYDYVRAHAGRGPALRLYFVSGAFETPEGQPALDQARMVDSLRAAGVPAASMHAIAPADGKHKEWFWRREFPAAYHWLFDDAPRSTRRSTHASDAPGADGAGVDLATGSRHHPPERARNGQ